MRSLQETCWFMISLVVVLDRDRLENDGVCAMVPKNVYRRGISLYTVYRENMLQIISKTLESECDKKENTWPLTFNFAMENDR